MIHPQAFRKLLLLCFQDSQVPRKVLVALSGGVDSVCLTYLLSQYRDEFDPSLELHAITIDHNYRKDSNKEALMVGELVSKWNVLHHIHKLKYDKPLDQITNFEEVARTKRYDVFNQISKDLDIHNVFVAHNFNDQLETCMQRIQQKSTVFGLIGLKQRALIPVPGKYPFSVSKPVEVVRPLLDFTKSEIINTCVSNNVNWFEDHTNQDIFLTDRNLFRVALNEFIPKALELDPESPYKYISQEQITDTIHRSKLLVNYVRAQTKGLYKKLIENNQLVIDERNGSVYLSIPRETVLENGTLALSRFFYELLFPFSASKNYFFSYTKVLRGVAPRIYRCAEEEITTPEKFTSVHLLFDMSYKDGNVVLKITRQPILRSEVNKVKQKHESTSTVSDWILYDNRYWLRFLTSFDVEVQILPLYPKHHAKLLLQQFGGLVPEYSALGTPFLIFSNGAVALPTYGLIPRSASVECYLKDNELTYV